MLKYRILKPAIGSWKKTKTTQIKLFTESVGHEVIDNYLYYKL